MARKSHERDAPPPTSAPARRHDWLFAGIDQLFVVAYAYVLAVVLPNRHASASVHLWSIPVLMQTLAIAMTCSRSATGWWLAIGAGSALLLSTVLLIARLVASAAYVAGVYGAFGQATALNALIAVALVIELVALLPIVQLRYLLARRP